ncbi:MAG: CDP-alcohol phosphatidyltransferase family protein [Anaerohalosphaeraceae bacterium]|nr:CDP-alcohol phosphatidyltransferase family protein [Anaerohalosphaeraceae bacterium]
MGTVNKQDRILFKQIPNMLTLGRLVLTIVFLWMILCSPNIEPTEYSFFLDIAFALFIITGLTDIADGKIARKYNITSKFGRIVDPLADKCLVCGAFVCFAIIGEPVLFGWPPKTLAVIQWATAGIIIVRELFVTILRHVCEAKGIKFPATVSGKLKMFIQAFAIGTVIVRMAHVHPNAWGYWFTLIVYLLTIGITIVSGVLSVRKAKPVL